MDVNFHATRREFSVETQKFDSSGLVGVLYLRERPEEGQVILFFRSIEAIGKVKAGLEELERFLSPGAGGDLEAVREVEDEDGGLLWTETHAATLAELEEFHSGEPVYTSPGCTPAGPAAAVAVNPHAWPVPEGIYEVGGRKLRVSWEPEPVARPAGGWLDPLQEYWKNHNPPPTTLGPGEEELRKLQQEERTLAELSKVDAREEYQEPGEVWGW